MIGLALVIASAFALGAALVSRSGVARTRLAQLALALPVGVAGLAGMALALCAAGLTLSRGLVLGLCAAALCAGALWGRRWPESWGWPRPKSPLERYALLATLFAAALILAVSLTTPLVSVDARILWSYHARLIADTGSYPAPELRDPRFLIAHAEYPPLLPMAEALVAVADGSADERALRTVPTLLALAAAVLLFAELPRRDPRHGLLLAAAFALMPTFMSYEEGGADAGDADAPLAGFVLASAVALDGGSPLLAGALAGAAALTKNEGLLLGALLCASAWLPRRKPVRESGAMTAAFLAPVAAGLLLRAGLSSSFDERYLTRLLAGGLGTGWLRAPALLLEMLKTGFFMPHRGGLLPWLAVLLWAASPRRAAIFAEGRLFIVPAFFACVWLLYAISPWPGVMQVQLSFPRIVLQVAPLALYALTLPISEAAPSR